MHERDKKAGDVVEKLARLSLGALRQVWVVFTEHSTLTARQRGDFC